MRSLQIADNIYAQLGGEGESLVFSNSNIDLWRISETIALLTLFDTQTSMWTFISANYTLGEDAAINYENDLVYRGILTLALRQHQKNREGVTVTLVGQNTTSSSVSWKLVGLQRSGTSLKYVKTNITLELRSYESEHVDLGWPHSVYPSELAYESETYTLNATSRHLALLSDRFVGAYVNQFKAGEVNVTQPIVPKIWVFSKFASLNAFDICLGAVLDLVRGDKICVTLQDQVYDKRVVLQLDILLLFIITVVLAIILWIITRMYCLPHFREPAIAAVVCTAYHWRDEREGLQFDGLDVALCHPNKSNVFVTVYGERLATIPISSEVVGTPLETTEALLPKEKAIENELAITP
ncbi:hypothetical protein Unana1_07344 [Umbelopsis nana]